MNHLCEITHYQNDKPIKECEFNSLYHAVIFILNVCTGICDDDIEIISVQPNTIKKPLRFLPFIKYDTLNTKKEIVLIIKNNYNKVDTSLILQRVLYTYNIIKEYFNVDIIELRLYDLKLEDSDITDELEQMTEIKTLNLQYNNLTHLPKLPPNLKYLYIRNNKITSLYNTNIQDSLLELQIDQIIINNDIQSHPQFNKIVKKIQWQEITLYRLNNAMFLRTT